jgi:hypothetical protein
LERAGRITLIVLIAALAAGAAAALSWWPREREGDTAGSRRIPGEQGRVVVEVLNATAVDGLAREVARRLRRAGIDVVNYGSERDSTLDSTTIVIRRGDSTAAREVRQVLGLGRVRVERDARLLVDASVLVGPDLARALGFHP